MSGIIESLWWKVFERKTLLESLDECLNEGCSPLFMPSIIDMITLHNDRYRPPFRTYFSQSIRVTGKSEEDGEPVVVYAHAPHYLSDPRNLERAIKEGLVEGTVAYPEDEFQKLLELEEANKKVIAVGYLKTSMGGHYRPHRHPEGKMFCGGKDRVNRFFREYRDFDPNIAIPPAANIHDADPPPPPKGPMICLKDGLHERPLASFLAFVSDGTLLAGRLTKTGTIYDNTFRLIGIPGDPSDFDRIRAEIVQHYKGK